MRIMRCFSLPSLWISLVLCIVFARSVFAQTTTRSHTLKVGARNSTIRNIGSLQADSALIFPKRNAQNDTTHSQSLRRKGAFFYDTITKIVWFFDGEHFRQNQSAGGKHNSNDKNIYDKSDSIKTSRVVTLQNRSKKSQTLHFAQGSVHIDTLLIKPLKGRTTDSFLTRFHDTVRYVTADSLPNIYNKNGTIKENRVVEIQGKDKKNLQFKSGAVIFDTLLLKNHNKGNSFDSVLVVRNDSVYRIGRDSLFNIYNKSDSIKEARVVTLRGRQNKKASVYFKGGQFSLDTLLIRQKNRGTSRDSFLVRFKDTVRYIPFDSLRTIYNVDDSIKTKRVVTISDKDNKSKSLHFTKGAVHIDTLLLKNHNKGNSFDSVLVVRNDSVYRIGRDSLFNIYNKSDSIREHRIVTIRNKDKNKDVKLAFKEGRVEIDTLLIRKRRIGKAKDSFLTVWKDTVRSVPFDSLWNIYSKDDSIRNTGRDNKRKVILNNKQLIFINKNNNTNNNSGRIGILQDNPKYTLDIATASYMKNKTGSNSGGNNSTDDNIAVRISHNVQDNQNRTINNHNYGLVISEFSNKAHGRSAIGFQSGEESRPFMKAALWATVGQNKMDPVFGISTAAVSGNSNSASYTLQPRMFINKDGNVRIGFTQTQYDFPIRFPARLTINSARWGASMDMTQNDNSGYKPENVAILANLSSQNKADFKYGLVIREADFNAASKIGIGFYNGGWGGQTNHMSSRIWASSGSGAINPIFGIDVSANGGYSNQAQLTTRMVIDKNGNVGMGTTNPSTNLDIVRKGSDNTLRIRAGALDKISAVRLSTSVGDTGYIVSYKPKDSVLRFSYQQKVNGRNNNQNIYNGLDSILILTVKNKSGYLGVGTGYEAEDILINVKRSGHSNFLRIQGGNNNNKYSGLWLTEDASKQGWQIRENSQNHSLEFCPTEANGNCTANSSNNSFNGIFFSKNGTTGSATLPTPTTTTGSNVATIHSPLYASSSDSNLKKQIRNLDNSVSEKLLKLRPVQYRWKHDTTNWTTAIRFGLIAQEVEKIFPNMVLNSQINGQTRKFISYLDLIAPIIKTLQAQNQQVQELNKQNQELRSELQQIHNELQQIRGLLKLNPTQTSKIE